MKNKNSWNPDMYDKHARFVSDLAGEVLELLNPKKDMKVLDVGCGDGVLSKKIEEITNELVAIDYSKEMVQKAKSNGIDASMMSVTDMPFNGEFDAVFSNAALHWVKDAKKATRSIYKSLKKSGIFVAEFGGYGNVETILSAVDKIFKKHDNFGEFKNPWYFPTISEYRKLLENQGFKVEYMELIPRNTKIDDISNWLDLFTNGITSHLSQEQKDTFKNDVSKLLKQSRLYSEKGGWIADYVRIRLKAKK